MANGDTPPALKPSLLDRLTDPESRGAAWRRGYGVQQMQEAVKEDIENLLNAQWVHPDLPVEYQELQGSLLRYGLPDTYGINAAAAKDRAAIARLVEEVIVQFEPRLRDVHVEQITGQPETDRRLRFRISARLRVDPAPALAFDTILELATGRYKVTAATP